MQPIFYVISENPIVNLDLAGALQAQFPDGLVSVYGGLHALPQTHNLDHLFVFVEKKLIATSDVTFLEFAARNGAMVIVIGGYHEAGFVAGSLEVPFTNKMIADAVVSATISQHAVILRDRTKAP